MGVYFNSNNESFTQAKNSLVYVDKTGLLEILNNRLSTEDKCIALSHARRFGKSHAAGMIDAYYSLGCDSTKLFENTKIAKNSDFKKYMNKYNEYILIYHLFGIFTKKIWWNPYMSVSVKISKRNMERR